MSIAVLKKTESIIELAYKENDLGTVEKETFSLLNVYTNSIPENFSNHVKFMSIRHAHLKEPQAFLTDEHKTNMKQLLKALEGYQDKEFGRIKLLYDKFFLETTKSGFVEYQYNVKELISVETAAESLGVSRQSVYKYLKNGLESQKINGTTKIPKTVVEMWKNPSTAFELQWVFQQNTLRNQTLEEKYEEIQNKIQEFELDFGATFDELYGGLSDEDIDGLDEAMDVYDWKDYLEMKKTILKQIKENKLANA